MAPHHLSQSRTNSDILRCESPLPIHTKSTTKSTIATKKRLQRIRTIAQDLIAQDLTKGVSLNKLANSQKIGLDLIRVISTFAVVLLHSGDDALVPITNNADILRSYFVFPVPVFLALSFYLASKSILVRGHLNLSKKLTRLLIPYGFFSGIYLFYDAIEITDLRLIPYLQRVFAPLVADPIGIVFLGEAYVHLYFFPLLIVGTVAIHYLSGWLKQRSAVEILGLTIVSAIAYHWLTMSGNAFIIEGPSTAFQSLLPSATTNPFLRLLATYGALLIRCLPYIFLAFFIASKTGNIGQRGNLNTHALAHSLANAQAAQTQAKSAWSKRQKLIISWTCLGMTIFILTFQNALSPVLRDIILAFLLLIFGLGISHKIKHKTFLARTIITISQGSFGIYLIHHIYLGLFKKIEAFLPFYNEEVITAGRIFTFAVFGFVISFITIKSLSRYIHQKRPRQCLGL